MRRIAASDGNQPAQVEFHGGWRGDLVKVFTAKEALIHIGALRGGIS